MENGREHDQSMKAKPKTFPSKLNGESSGTLDNGGDKSGVALCESEGVGMKWVSGPPPSPKAGQVLPLAASISTR